MTSFAWVDGERLIRFGPGALAEAPELLRGRALDRYALLTTPRALGAAAVPTELVDGAGIVVDVPAGQVPDAAAAVRGAVSDAAGATRGALALVALGGGRVVDVAKALAAADGHVCAALPTTLAGSPMTRAHRLPAGVEGVAPVRPALVVWDPGLHATLPRAQLAATALNALAHAFEALYGPRANPVCELAALRATELIGGELRRRESDLARVALGALLGGYALGATGFAIHHATCQTVVRTAGTPHAETNAAVLPHSAAFMAARAPTAVAAFADALAGPADRARAGGRSHGPVADLARRRVAALSAEAGVTGLAGLGLDADALPALAAAVTRHPALANTPGGPPTEGDIAAILTASL